MKNIFKILIIPVLLVTSLTVTAKNDDKKVAAESASSLTCSILGQVVDQATGESLAGVVVKVAGTDKFTYTDFDGRFIFAGLGQGYYTLESTLISYENGLVNNFEINAGEQKSVEINLSKSN